MRRRHLPFRGLPPDPAGRAGLEHDMTNDHPAPEPPDAPPPDGGRAGGLRKTFADIGRRVTGGIRTARTGAARLIERAPETMHAARAGAQGLTAALQKLPDSKLRWLAAGSVGVGAGFYLSRAPRVVVAAGVVPAVVMGAAIASRPEAAGGASGTDQ
jgi:hypothetical protein